MKRNKTMFFLFIIHIKLACTKQYPSTFDQIQKILKSNLARNARNWGHPYWNSTTWWWGSPMGATQNKMHRSYFKKRYLRFYPINFSVVLKNLLDKSLVWKDLGLKITNFQKTALWKYTLGVNSEISSFLRIP